MGKLKITQIKSRIGATARQKKNLDALGLRKINQTVEHSDSAIILGMVEKVRHLCTIETIEEKAAKPKKAKAEPKAEAATETKAEATTETQA